MHAQAILFTVLVPMVTVLVPMAILAEEGDDRFKSLPGREVVKPMKPDWCDSADVDDYLMNTGNPIAVAQRSVDNRWDEKALRLISQVACVRPNDAEIQEKVAQWRQGYINLIGTTEREDREALKLRASNEFEKQRTTWCESIKPDEEASLPEKSLWEAMAAGTGCAVSGHGGMALNVYADGMNKELGWWIDARAAVESEITHAVYVARCLRILRDNADWPDAKNATVMAAYAACGPDARRLDKGKLEKELGDAKFNDFARLNAREVFALAKATAHHLTAAYKKMAAKDEAYQKLLFDAPEKGWANWEKAYAANQEAFEAARAYEKKYYGPSKKALQGCSETLRKGFSSFLKAQAPKGPDEARAAALGPIGYVLLESLALCDAVEGRLQVAKTYVELLNGEGRGAPALRRGPRIAAYNTALGTLSEILADRERFPVREFYLQMDPPRETPRDGATEYYANKVLFAEDPRGTLSAIRRSGDLIRISFKPVTTYVMNRICKPNKRILRIEAGGQVIYDSDCYIGNPPKVPITTKEKPLDVPAAVAEGLKVGQTATFSVNERDEPAKTRDGIPKEVWDAGLKKLLVWYGVSL